jgi:hypothetical protein
MIAIQDLIIMVLSVLAGTVVTWYFARRRGRLGLVLTDAIPIVYQLQQGLPGLVIQYENEPVRSNVVWLGGILVNTGSRDITDEMTKSPIVLELHKNAK